MGAGKAHPALQRGTLNIVLEPFLYAVSRYPEKLVVSRIAERVFAPILKGLHANDLPPNSPFHFIDYETLSERFFECASGPYVPSPARSAPFTRI